MASGRVAAELFANKTLDSMARAVSQQRRVTRGGSLASESISVTEMMRVRLDCVQSHFRERVLISAPSPFTVLKLGSRFVLSLPSEASMAHRLNSWRVGVIGPPFAREWKWPAKERDLVTIKEAGRSGLEFPHRRVCLKSLMWPRDLGVAPMFLSHAGSIEALDEEMLLRDPSTTRFFRETERNRVFYSERDSSLRPK